MALVPFSYANPFTDQLQLRERLFTIDGQLLKIQQVLFHCTHSPSAPLNINNQAWKGDGRGGTKLGFGASVYPAAYVLAEYLERHPYLVRGKRVIELGTGTGFVGIAAAFLGAAEVCLTDGDDDSVRLTKENVDLNLLSARCDCGRDRRCGCERSPDATCCDQHDTCQDTTSLSGSGSSSGSGSGSSNSSYGGSIANATYGFEGSGGSVGGRRQRPALPATKISVQKLRWGCETDMENAGCHGDGSTSGGGVGWDLVLGSDIAALPYAAAYGDLLRTIVSLVNINAHGGGSGKEDGAAASSPPQRKASGSAVTAADATVRENGVDRGKGAEPVEEDTAKRRRRAVVLLAHKRRHVSEDAFFDDLREKLGGEGSVRPMREEDIHADFRHTGIRLHMFEVGV